MRNRIIQRIVKAGIILTMLAIGIMIGAWNNYEADQVEDNRQYGAVNTENNWWLISPMLAIITAFIPAGWLIGRKIDEDN